VIKLENNTLTFINIITKVTRPYPGIAPGGYSIHYTNTNPNPYQEANTG